MGYVIGGYWEWFVYGEVPFGEDRKKKISEKDKHEKRMCEKRDCETKPLC